MAHPRILDLQRPEVQNSESFFDGIDQAAEAMTDGLLVYDNFAVYALAGNANDHGLQEHICRVKGDARGTKQPVGWTRAFDEQTLSTFDISGVDDPYMRQLLRDPDELTALIGGLSFLRGSADMKAKERYGIPDSIIPVNIDVPQVQIYSPEGTATTDMLVQASLKKGAEPVMTSANISGLPETIYDTTATEFAAQAPEPLTVVVNKSDGDKPDRPRGSYPVIEVLPDRFNIVRPGCFDPEILRTALHDYPIQLDPNPQPSKYPGNILKPSDLPTDLQYLKGTEFRLGLLAFLGWS